MKLWSKKKYELQNFGSLPRNRFQFLNSGLKIVAIHPCYGHTAQRELREIIRFKHIVFIAVMFGLSKHPAAQPMNEATKNYFISATIFPPSAVPITPADLEKS